MVSLPSGSTLGRYRIRDQIGRGGMATVFKALDPRLKREVAIKVLPSYYTEDPTFVDRFTQEAQAIAQLNHPNIVTIHDFGEDKGFTYIVTDFVPGGTLQDKLFGKPLSLDETLTYMKPLAGALDHAHSEGIIHRDLKPANVLLDAQSQPILADFGLARMLEGASRFTLAQQVLGTPQYMSPEQALGGDIDHRSDLYSFGVMIFEMLVGQPPFQANSPTATMMAHIHQPPPLPTVLNPELDPVLAPALLKSLYKDRDSRFSTATMMIDALERGGQADGGSGGQPTLAISTDPETIALPKDGVDTEIADRAATVQDRPPTRRRWIMVALALVVVSAAIGILTVSSDGDPPPIQETPSPGPVPTSTSLVVAVPPEPTATPEATPEATPQPTATPEAAPVPTATPEVTPQPTAIPTLGVSPIEIIQAWERKLAQIRSRLVLLRHLNPESDIVAKFRTREELVALTEGYLKRRYLRDEIFEAEELYKSLGLLAASDDLEEIILGIQVQQTNALFDDELEALYVISEAPGPVEEWAVAGLYATGIQQQVFDVVELRRQARPAGNSDLTRALGGLTQGDVAAVLRDYANFFSEDEKAELARPLPNNLVRTAPDVVQKAMFFPLIEGASFVENIKDALGSWEAFNSVYDRPPISTEQILHPDKYLTGEVPLMPKLPELEDALGKGWNVVSVNTMGEFLLRTYLEDHLDLADASAAAAGWRGDRYALLIGPEGERVLALTINWDTPEDSAEFFGTFQSFVENKTGGGATRRSDGENQRWWLTPEGTTFLLSSDTATLLILGDTEPVVLQVLQPFLGQ